MSRRRLAAWLVSFPLMVVGSQVAHGLAYRWVYPNAHVRLSALLWTGHSYMGTAAYLPVLLGALAASELIGVGWVCAGSFRHDLRRPLPAWGFALMPMLGFTLQELLERWLSDGRIPWWMVLQPTFRAGLLLQLPFALAAYLLARVLLRVADEVGVALRGAVPRPALGGVSLRWVVVEASSPQCRGLASGHSSRGPPGLIAPALIAL